MELVPCPIAGDREFTPWIEAPDRFDASGPTWSIVRSKTSGLVMLNPRPDESEAPRHYPSRSYDPFIDAGNLNSARDALYLGFNTMLLFLKASIVMKGLRKPKERIRLLEVGCSGGRLLRHLHRHCGLRMENLFGIEPDAGAMATARGAGVDRVCRSVDELPAGLRFDRIVCWHSLEHIHRIGETLEKLRGHLEPEGMLVIALPNIDSRDASIYGNAWVALDAPRHLYHFTPASLRTLLGLHGFSVVEVTAYLPDAIYNTWHSEQLACRREGRKFLAGGLMRAIAAAGVSIVAGRDPSRASGFCCRAVAAGQEPGSDGEMRPRDFSSSVEAMR